MADSQSNNTNDSLENMDIGISEEDRREVLQSIERITSENQIVFEDNVFDSAFKKAKSGVVFPIIVNILSLVVVGIAIFFLSRAFQSETNTLVSSPIEFASLESQLLRELQEESKNQISAKEEEINAIEERLSTLESQREELNANLDARLEDRESQYAQELQIALESERRRLESEGLDLNEIERLLNIQEDELRSYYSQELEVFQTELDTERAEFQANIERLQGEYSLDIEKLIGERQSLTQEFEVQESNLRAQIEQQSAAIEESKAQSDEALANLQSAKDELASLEKARENAEAIEAQLLGLFDRLKNTLDIRSWGQGREIIGQIRSFLNEDQVVAIEGLADRRSTYIFFLSTVENYINTIISNEESRNSIAGQLELLSRIRVNGQRASSAVEEGNQELANDIYSETMSLIPELTVANQVLIDNALTALNNEITEQLADELQDRRNTIAELLQVSEIAIAQGEYDIALTNFDQMLQNLPEFEDTAQSINSNLVGMGYAFSDIVVNRSSTEEILPIFQRVGIDPSITLSVIDQQIDAAVLSKENILLAEIANLQSDYESQQVLYEERITSLTNQIALSQTEYEEELFDLNETLNNEINAIRSERNVIAESRINLEQRIADLQGEIDKLADFEEQLNSIQAKYSTYKINVDAIRSSSEANANFLVRSELEDFVGSPELESIFPNLRQEIRFNYLPSENAGREDGLNLAKDIVSGFILQATNEQRRLYLETQLQYAREDNEEIMEAFLIDILDAIQ